MAKSYTSRPEGTVSVRLDLDAAAHDLLRIRAAAARMPMSRYVRQVVQDHLAGDVAKKQHGPGKSRG